MRLKQWRRILLPGVLIAATALLAAAQDAKIKINILHPEEAYIFVDGRPTAHRTSTLALTPGDHTIGIYNYGFTPQINKVSLKEGENPEIEVRLTPVPGMVSGPWGRIQIEGIHNGAAVFLNEKRPEFFVGHVDEMNHNIMARQQLVVPPGTHQLFVVDPKDNKELWSGPVKVLENQRVIVNIKNGSQIYKPWSEGATIGELKRFEAGTATASIAVAPVKGTFGTNLKQISCGDPVELKWSTENAAYSTITANQEKMGTMPVSGEETVHPKKNTTYEFRAAGPGGDLTSTAAVNVKDSVQTSLKAFPAEIHYRRVGDKVVEQDSATLRWTAENADKVTLEPIGPVSGASGETTVKAAPKAAGEGPIDETQTYKITATNACGGSDTSTVSLRVTGAVEPEQVAMAEPPEEMPQTASPVPLLGLLGLGSLAAGLALRKVRKQA